MSSRFKPVDFLPDDSPPHQWLRAYNQHFPGSLHSAGIYTGPLNISNLTEMVEFDRLMTTLEELNRADRVIASALCWELVIV